MTCPELTFGVSYFSQWMHNPSEGMLKGVVRMFRYLKFIVLNNCEGVYAHRGRNPFPGVIKATKNQLYGLRVHRLNLFERGEVEEPILLCLLCERNDDLL